MKVVYTFDLNPLSPGTTQSSFYLSLHQLNISFLLDSAVAILGHIFLEMVILYFWKPLSIQFIFSIR